MLKLRNVQAQPRTGTPSPSYPRLLGIGLALALSACGGQAVENSSNGEGGAAGSAGSGGGGAGGMPEPYDGGEPEAEPIVQGDIAPPFDAGAEADTEPPLAGDIAPPFDAGEDVYVEPDAELGGAVPLPYDGGEETDAEIGGGIPIPFDGGQS